MNAGGERVARFVAQAVGGGVAGGLACATVFYVWIFRVSELPPLPGERALVTRAVLQWSLLQWLAIAVLFAALRCFLPATTSAGARAWLWVGFVPVAVCAGRVGEMWGVGLVYGPTTPWATLQRLLEGDTFTWKMLESLVRPLLRDALPLAAAGLVATAPVRLQVAACGATGLLAGALLAALRPDWASPAQRAIAAAFGLVPLALLLGALFLERETVAGPGEATL